MNKLNMALTVLLVLALGGAISTMPLQTVTSQQVVANTNRVLARNAAIVAGTVRARPKEQMVSGGVMTAYLERTRAAAPRGANPPVVFGAGASLNTLGCSNVFAGPFPNIRVNQDCSFRRQAEEAVAIDPNNFLHLMVGQNDSRIGFNHCGIDFSFKRGATWGDLLPPFYQFIMLDGHTADACSDPTLAFDSRSNVYFGGIIFDVLSSVSAVVVTKSNSIFGGTFFHSPDSTQPSQAFLANPLGVVANDGDPNIFNDKEFMNVDANRSSPKRDYVYMTWTRFNGATGAGVGGDSPIYFSQSTNGGATWSPGIEISGANAAICTFVSGEPDAGACDQDQGSWPEVGPDGNLYVSFNNSNTPTLGVNQQLLVTCPVTADCSVATNWTAPVKIADDFGTQPISAPIGGCPGGRQCLPPNGYRLDDFGVVHADPSTAGRLYFVWSDFRNGGPCAPGLLEPCANHNNDVFLARSDDGGATWGAPVNVTPSSTFGTTAQWQAWFAVGPTGMLYIAFYDRHYGDCETSGCNDITLATMARTATSFTYYRITTASMPNLTPTTNVVQQGFLGDYMFVAADRFGAVIVWADTRPRPGISRTPEEDIYFARFP
jgi:hypothetical protein